VSNPKIQTEYGFTTEMARRQAAANMREDDSIRQRVEQHLVEKLGSYHGLEEAKRRYREAYGWRKFLWQMKVKIFGGQ